MEWRRTMMFPRKKWRTRSILTYCGEIARIRRKDRTLTRRARRLLRVRAAIPSGRRRANSLLLLKLLALFWYRIACPDHAYLVIGEFDWNIHDLRLLHVATDAVLASDRTRAARMVHGGLRASRIYVASEAA